jgi:hypothetical protein
MLKIDMDTGCDIKQFLLSYLAESGYYLPNTAANCPDKRGEL